MIEYEHRTKHIIEIIEKVEWVGIDPDDLTRYIMYMFAKLYCIII